MKILYILGNGFDKAQGMKTSYPEFYQYLMKNTDNGSALLQQLKREINDNNQLWSDMELALGEFTSHVQSASDFDSLYFELSDHLQDYLRSEEERFLPTDELKNKFKEDVINPFVYLENDDKSVCKRTFKNEQLNTSTQEISVMTFNYTNTIEKLVLPMHLVENKDIDKVDYDYSIDASHVLKRIIHVHGRLGDSIIIGVDNGDQIKNSAFRVNEDIKDLLVKEQSNRVMGYTRHNQCEKLIADADLIILYGLSLGETDSRWWKRIGKKFSMGKLVIIQHLYDPNFIKVTPNRKQRLGRIDRNRRNFIMKKMNVYESEFSNGTKERLFFVTNSDIFKL